MNRSLPLVVVLFAGALALRLGAAETPDTVVTAFPGLATGVLTSAKLADLPDGMLLQSETFKVTGQDVADELAKVPEQLRAQFKNSLFFFLEQMSTERLLLADARRAAAANQRDLAGVADREVIRQYLGTIGAGAEVKDPELAEFYQQNTCLWNNATLDQVRGQIKDHLLQQKRDQAILAQFRTLGERVPVTVSRAWAKAQAVAAKDNPIDRARAAGKPVLVSFSSGSCCGPDKLVPVLQGLEAKYRDKLTIVTVSPRQEQVLAARFGVDTVPTLILYHKDGHETWRQVGFLTSEDIQAHLPAAGSEE